MALNDANIDETMAADWAGIREKFKEEIPEPEPVAEPEILEAPAQEPAADPGRERNEDGTFKPKAAEPAKAAEPVDKNPSPAEPVTQEPVIAAKGTPLDITKAPSSWKPMARADFAKIPESARAEIHRRETESTRIYNEMLPTAVLGKAIKEAAAPYQALIDAEANGKPELAFAELMKTAAVLRMGTPEQKRNVVLGVARQYGVDLSQLQPTPGAAPPQQAFQDPRVDQLLQHLQTQEQLRVQSEQQQLLDSVSRWVDQKDETGNPKYPYLNDVQSEMSVLVPMIRQSNPSLSHEQVLQSAYDRAIWANPDVKAVLQATADPARDAANQTRVREAKRAASVNVPRRASVPSPGKPGKMEDTIENTARELGFLS